MDRFRRRNNPSDYDEPMLSANDVNSQSRSKNFTSVKMAGKPGDNDSNHRETFEDIVPIVDEYVKNSGNNSDDMEFEVVEGDFDDQAGQVLR